jgi:O-antigen/teichoic acid export membrane protein
MGVMNLTTYGFTIVAARLLGPSHYGALAAMMGLLLVVNVLSLGLQATAARRVSSAPEQTTVIEHQIMAVSYRAAAAAAILCLLATPVMVAFLHLDNPLTAVMLAITAAPLTVMGGQAGVLQGERRWAPLALIYLMSGLGRLAVGLVALVMLPTELGAMIGVAIGAFCPTIVGWFALRQPARVAHHAERAGASAVPPVTRGLLREVAHNSHALLAFFALSNADVVVARTTLDVHQAGLYAGGLILAKAVLFLPQFVVVIAFPSMASGERRRSMHLKGLGLVLLIGLCTIAGAALLSSLAVVFIGGPEYAALQSRLWAFAGLGTLLSMLQLMVYDVVARQHQRAVFVIWAALFVVLVSAGFLNTLTELLTVVGTTDATLLGVLLLVSLRKPHVGRPTETPDVAPVA